MAIIARLLHVMLIQFGFFLLLCEWPLLILFVATLAIYRVASYLRPTDSPPQA